MDVAIPEIIHLLRKDRVAAADVQYLECRDKILNGLAFRAGCLEVRFEYLLVKDLTNAVEVFYPFKRSLRLLTVALVPVLDCTILSC